MVKILFILAYSAFDVAVPEDPTRFMWMMCLITSDNACVITICGNHRSRTSCEESGKPRVDLSTLSARGPSLDVRI